MVGSGCGWKEGRRRARVKYEVKIVVFSIRNWYFIYDRSSSEYGYIFLANIHVLRLHREAGSLKIQFNNKHSLSTSEFRSWVSKYLSICISIFYSFWNGFTCSL